MRILPAFLIACLPCFVPSCDSDSPKPRARLGFSDERRPVTVRAGEEFEIVLGSNATTGYHWRLVEPPDPAVGTFLAREYVSDANPKHLTGVGGTEYWAFKALKAGRARVGFRYSRGEADTEPGSSKTFDLTVR